MFTLVLLGGKLLGGKNDGSQADDQQAETNDPGWFYRQMQSGTKDNEAMT
jgi:hypothetical protein